ncbi:MAG: hypothetical protein QM831_02260 [Kofleriaceae bacterium]
MPSLLVYVDLARLGEVLDLSRRDTGQTWHLARTDLNLSELDRLDHDGMLFICTLDERGDGENPTLVAWGEDFDFDADGFTGADLVLRDHDLRELLPRLGCTIPLYAFANRPRVLPPGDVELIRYVLGLADDRRRAPPAPEPIVADDDELRSLRAAVYDDPAADEPREIYADALLARGDPRGEFIGLQLARAREGRRIPSLRERQLHDRVKDAILGQLAPHLDSYIIERGFLRAASTKLAPAKTSIIPDAVARDRRWSTVEHLCTSDRELLFNPFLRATRLGVTSMNELPHLAESLRPHPYEMIGGYIDFSRPESIHRQTGAPFRAWSIIVQSKAFPKLRTLSLDYVKTRVQGYPLATYLENPLVDQLDHLDFYLRSDRQLPRELAVIAPVKIRRLTFRVDLVVAGRVTSRFLFGHSDGKVILESPSTQQASLDELGQLQPFIGLFARNGFELVAPSETRPSLAP